MIKITFDLDKCKGCGLCISTCPRKLLEVDTQTINMKGHHPAKITDASRCVGCASCAKMCPDCVIKIEKE